MREVDHVLQGVSYGLYVVGANDGDRLAGCIINAMMQITAENPIVAISLNKKNHTYDMIRRTGSFSISILSEKTDPTVIGRLGFTSGWNTDKFAGVDYQLEDGLPLITSHPSGHLFCELLSVHEASTHMVVFGRALSAKPGEGFPPMTYRYYHEVIKGRAHENAPTFHQNQWIEERREGKVVEEKKSYVCTVCGYVYEGDLEQEPDEYVCPICGVGKDQFEKQ